MASFLVVVFFFISIVCLMLYLNTSTLSEQSLRLLPKNEACMVDRDEFLEPDTSNFKS